MITEIARGAWTVETAAGETRVVAFDLVPYRVLGTGPACDTFKPYVEGDPVSFDAHPWAYIARMTMPGYLDSTEWCGPYTSAKQALGDVWQQHGCPSCASEDIAGEECGAWHCGECGYSEQVR